MHVTSGFASDLWHKNSSVGLTRAHPISVLVSVYNRQLCKLIVGSICSIENVLRGNYLA